MSDRTPTTNRSRMMPDNWIDAAADEAGRTGLAPDGLRGERLTGIVQARR